MESSSTMDDGTWISYFRSYLSVSLVGDDDTRVLPRLSLVQALQENFLADPESFEPFSEELQRKLDAVLEEVRDGAGIDGLKRIVEIIDSELVNFLRENLEEENREAKKNMIWSREEYDLEPTVMSRLGCYFPRAGQTWNSFLQNRTSTERRLFDAEKNASRKLKLKLKEVLLTCIQELNTDLRETRLTRSTQTYNVVKIFYATDRRLTVNGKYTGATTERTASKLHYGWVKVGIPGAHKKSFPVKDFQGPGDQSLFFSLNRTPRSDFGRFSERVNKDLEKSGNGSGDLLIIIHGCNTTHSAALERAAQLKYDLDFKGTVVLYSWSATDNLSGFCQDEENADSTTNLLTNFLRDVMDEVHSEVHTLAYNMGCGALIGTLRDLQKEWKSRSSRCPLSETIFVAPVEGSRPFEEPDSDDHLRHVTVYWSDENWPRLASLLVDPDKRVVADMGSHFDGFDWIDISHTREGAFTSCFYHHTVSPKVIMDISDLLSRKVRAIGRPNLNLSSSKFGRQRFYTFQGDEGHSYRTFGDDPSVTPHEASASVFLAPKVESTAASDDRMKGIKKLNDAVYEAKALRWK